MNLFDKLADLYNHAHALFPPICHPTPRHNFVSTKSRRLFLRQFLRNNRSTRVREYNVKVVQDRKTLTMGFLIVQVRARANDILQSIILENCYYTLKKNYNF